MRILENKSSFEPLKMIQIAQRENNSKRSFLYVNRYQAKHVPVSPATALKLFQQLGNEIYSCYKGQSIVFIGFAETATAIGAAVAAGFQGEEAWYLQTTRESLPETLRVLEFQEEHSHAVEQSLYCKDRKGILGRAERIIFVEDEVTTGKTILNFISALKKAGFSPKYSVASLLNSMNEDRIEEFQKQDICIHYLIRLEHTPSEMDVVPFSPDISYVPGETASVCQIEGRKEPRVGVAAQEYFEACQNFGLAVCSHFSGRLDKKKVLVLGTEECMYPAIAVGKKLDELYERIEVFTHATTRSPILSGDCPEYPIRNRCVLESVYEVGRKTYLYNLSQYDTVILVTDVLCPNEKGIADLAGALKACGNKEIHLVRWVKS